MCELLGMECNVPTDIVFSFSGLALRGGVRGPHADGWGLALYEGRAVRTFLEPAAAAESKLAAYIRKESIEEMMHAQQVIDRILYFDGAPNMGKYMKINVGKDVPEQFRNDLEVEYQAVPRLNKGIEIARAIGDNGTRALLEAILKEEEEHVDWLEAQLGLIKEIGVENYLARQIE